MASQFETAPSRVIITSPASELTGGNFYWAAVAVGVDPLVRLDTKPTEAAGRVIRTNFGIDIVVKRERDRRCTTTLRSSSNDEEVLLELHDPTFEIGEHHILITRNPKDLDPTNSIARVSINPNGYRTE